MWGELEQKMLRNRYKLNAIIYVQWNGYSFPAPDCHQNTALKLNMFPPFDGSVDITL